MIFDIAFGDLGLSASEFWNMSYAEFDIRARGMIRNEQRKWRHTRAIISALTGKDQRYIIELPGDWDGVPVTSEENAKKKLENPKIRKALEDARSKVERKGRGEHKRIRPKG